MEKEKKNQKEFSTCLEGIPFAEMMQKMMGRPGIGSLCREMMAKVMDKQGDGCKPHCAEMMGSMLKKWKGNMEKPSNGKKEESHV